MALWQDVYVRTIYPFEVSYLKDRPLQVRFEFASAGNVGVARYYGTMARIKPSQAATTDPREFFAVSYVGGKSSLRMTTRRGESEFRPGSLALLEASPGDDVRYGDDNAFVGMTIPRQQLMAMVPGVEDLSGSELAPNTAEARHLKRYLQFILDEDCALADTGLGLQVENILLDLAALVLGATRERQDLAKLRGLRAARLAVMLVEIRRHFAEPDFSAAAVAARLGLSVSSIQKILHETGRSFGERVQELRLQRALAMLGDQRCMHLKVSEIALACGFNEVSHFNHSFRRRFGATPTQCRGS
jgi:AraC-like DNA-binding protein